MSTFQKQASAIQRATDYNAPHPFSAKRSPAHSFAMTGRTGKRVQREDDLAGWPTDVAIFWRLVAPLDRETRANLGAIP